MPAIIRCVEFLDEFERHARALLGVGHGVRAVVPRTLHSACAERIAARATERVPIHHRETHVIAHRLALDDLVRVVMLERERILGTCAFEFDF